VEANQAVAKSQGDPCHRSVHPAVVIQNLKSYFVSSGILNKVLDLSNTYKQSEYKAFLECCETKMVLRIWIHIWIRIWIRHAFNMHIRCPTLPLFVLKEVSVKSRRILKTKFLKCLPKALNDMYFSVLKITFLGP
jgi:hypothetical protein